jgi:hypothetical protein
MKGNAMQKPVRKSPVALDYSKLLGFDQIASNSSALGNKLGAKVGAKPVVSLGAQLGAKVGAKVGLKPGKQSRF